MCEHSDSFLIEISVTQERFHRFSCDIRWIKEKTHKLIEGVQGIQVGLTLPRLKDIEATPP